MRKVRMPLMGMVVLALLGAQGIVAVALDAELVSEADALAPAVVTGTIRVVGPNQSARTESASPPMVATTRNYGWTVELGTDDPRLSGEWEVNSNYDTYESGATARTVIGRLTNEGGSWASVAHGFTPGTGVNYYANHLTGEDGYEGLSAMLLQRPAPGGWEVQGVIIPGSWPEPPEWVLPPAE